ncbi:hypothetical protein [Brevundimonas sp.]|uniref:hypothetical protein n=1 Tax=Brevundimonas sp. TaxID=1871086 RepID=UPI0019B88B81|nr:hypothetical protein [Brevundimonas sp.]MBD3838025.1 hypothetical protein [Brevundimonas sp.]
MSRLDRLPGRILAAALARIGFGIFELPAPDSVTIVSRCGAGATRLDRILFLERLAAHERRNYERDRIAEAAAGERALLEEKIDTLLKPRGLSLDKIGHKTAAAKKKEADQWLV